MIAISGDLEAPLSLGKNAVQFHELLHAMLSHRSATGRKIFPGLRPALAARHLGMDGPDVKKYRVIAQMVKFGYAGQDNKVFVLPRHAHAQHAAQHRDRPNAMMALDEGVLQIDTRAKYAVAYPRVPRSIFKRANSARSRLISICSELTFTCCQQPRACFVAQP